MRKIRTLSAVGIGIGCAAILYYFAAGIFGGFGTSVLWIWPAGGATLIALGAFSPAAWRRGGRPRLLITAAYALIGMCVLWFFAIQALVLSGMNDRAPAGADVILVLGAQVRGEAPGIALRERIGTAYDYLTANPEAKAILCGGQGAGEDITEAECMRRELVSRGITEERLILESRSTSTAENVRFARELAEDPSAAAVIVTSHFHMYRAVRLAKACGWENVYGEAAPFSPLLTPHYMAREFLTILADTRRGNLG